MAGIDLNTRSNYVAFPSKLSSEVWKKAIGESAVMRLGRKMALDASGTEINVIKSNASYSWNWGNETDERKGNSAEVEKKTIKPYEIYLIQPFSNKLRDNNTELYNAIVEDMPKVLGAGIDETVFTEKQENVGENFSTMSNIQQVSIQSDVWKGFCEAKKLIQKEKNRYNGMAISAEGEAHIEEAVDNVGKPLFIPDVINGEEVNKVRGRQCVLTDGLYIPQSGTEKEQLAIMGDWNKLRWGFLGDIKARIWDQALLPLKDGTTINLPARHMFAIEYYVEVGVGIEFEDAFVRLTGAEPASNKRVANNARK